MEEEFTYTESTEKRDKGTSVIEYAKTNYKGFNEIEQFRVADRIGSDHQPLECKLGTKILRDRKYRNVVSVKNIDVWDCHIFEFVT